MVTCGACTSDTHRQWAQGAADEDDGDDDEPETVAPYELTTYRYNEDEK